MATERIRTCAFFTVFESKVSVTVFLADFIAAMRRCVHPKLCGERVHVGVGHGVDVATLVKLFKSNWSGFRRISVTYEKMVVLSY
jgi:hypothetical protein